MTKRPIALIAAVGRNGVIGVGGGLPWRVREDMRLFRRLTMGKPVVMGRKTFQSIGKALSGRTTVVVTRGSEPDSDNVLLADSISSALEIADRDAIASGASEIMVAGGGEIYRAVIGRALRLYITRVDAAPDGDTRFPHINEAEWQEVSREPLPASEGDTAGAIFVSYRRRD